MMEKTENTRPGFRNEVDLREIKNPFKRFFLNDKNILALISLNALVIFMQGFKFRFEESTIQIFEVMDDVISIIFMLEVIVKSMHFGFREYIKSAWNKFDFLLIFLSIPSIFVHVFSIGEDVGFLLVFRVFRVFKFFRFVQFFPQVEHIFRSVQEALKASFMVLIAFFVFVFIMSIVSCFFYQDISKELFGDPIVAFYTTFQVFTVEGWNAVPDAIFVNSQEPPAEWVVFLTRAYFIMLLIFGGIFGLSIVNSIFVDAMISDNNDGVEERIDELSARLDEVLALLKEEKAKNKNNTEDNNESSSS